MAKLTNSRKIELKQEVIDYLLKTLDIPAIFVTLDMTVEEEAYIDKLENEVMYAIRHI